MKKVKRPEELERLRREILDARNSDRPMISVSSGTCGQARGSNDVLESLREAGDGTVEIKVTGCHGFCEAEPNLIIFPERIFYMKVSPKDAEDIIRTTVEKAEPVSHLLFHDPVSGQGLIHQDDIPFYKKQLRLLLKNNPLIDPTSLEDYLAVGGYASLIKTLRLDSTEVIEIIKKAGLRGRGGAGFPTGRKWELARKAKGEVKYLICNADEGDPGAYMDRSLLEGNPHSVIEGMIIGAYAIGAGKGWVYVRGEYPLAVKHTTIAVEQARQLGLLGENILDSGFNFDIQISTGAGAFVCGEETALIASIEGKRGSPRQRPPYPVEKGLFGRTTNINNVETWANVPLIIGRGAQWYSSIGTEGSKGTKIFSLVGKVKNTGLAEVPMGITLREVIFDIGGGMLDGGRFKAVQTGGPSGGCLPEKLLNLPVDYESLTKAGSIMGSGGMIVMDETTCMVDVAKYFLNFLRDESCGKCLPCRKGLQKLHDIVTDITEGRGVEEDIQTLSELGEVIRDTSLCGLGQTAPNPLLATLHYFRDEYMAHIRQKRCDAAVCKEIVSAPCQHVCPIGQEAGVYIGLIAQDRMKEAVEIVRKDNPLAAVLSRVCHHPCETKCRAAESGDPISIKSLKRFIADYGLRENIVTKAESLEKNSDGKVAVVGSGPAGLTCSYYLARKGYDVTIFEKLPVVGGMLAVGIPEYRLPRRIVNADIDFVRSAGVTIKTGVSLGDDFSLDDLFRQRYKAIFVATGAYESVKLGIANEEVHGVIPAMGILKEINLGKEVEIGKRVGVIGGGNAAIDVSRSLLRTGIPEEVIVFYRRTIHEMPAFKEEIEAALEEGVQIRFLTAPVKVEVRNGRLEGCQFVRMRLGEIDTSGRRKPIAIEGSEFTVRMDHLIVAIGEKPNTAFLLEENLEMSKRSTLVVDRETLLTNREGVFGGGDLVLGPSTVVEAVAHGKLAANSIDMLLRGEKPTRHYEVTRPSMYVEPVELSEEELSITTRTPVDKQPLHTRKTSFQEVEFCYSKGQAMREARRCLRCGLETREGQQFLEGLRRSIKEG